MVDVHRCSVMATVDSVPCTVGVFSCDGNFRVCAVNHFQVRSGALWTAFMILPRKTPGASRSMAAVGSTEQGGCGTEGL